MKRLWIVFLLFILLFILIPTTAFCGAMQGTSPNPVKGFTFQTPIAGEDGYCWVINWATKTIEPGLCGTGTTEVVDATIADGGNGDETHSYSKDDIRDYLAQHDPDFDGLPDGVEAGSITLAMLDNTSISAFAETLLDDANAATMLATLGINSAASLESSLSLGAYASNLLGMADASAVQAAMSVDDLITLSGVADGAQHLGEFTGTTINDNVTIKAALQALETAVEGAGGSDTTLDGVTAEITGMNNAQMLIYDGVGDSRIEAVQISGAISILQTGVTSIGVGAAIGDTAFTDLSAGNTYNNYGDADDDTIDELFKAIDDSWPSTSGAPTDASYLTSEIEAGLSAENVVSANGLSLVTAADYAAMAAIAGFQTALEGVLTLSNLQGAVTDSQVPNDITVDLATTATTANAGDSATAFFSSGTLEYARLPVDTDLSDGGTASTVPSSGAVATALGNKEDSDSNDIDPDRLNGDDTDDNLIAQSLVEGFNAASDPFISLLDSDGEGSEDADKETFRIYGNFETTTEDSEDADFWITTIQGGTRTEILRFDESDDRWETTKSIYVGGSAVQVGDIVIGDIAAAALVIESEGIGSNDNDTTIPTCAAVIDYVGGMGGGDVSKVGTPSNHQWGVWTGDGTIEGVTVTGSRAIVSDADGEPSASAITATEIGYLDNLTGNIQTQFSNILDGTTAFTDFNGADVIDSDNYNTDSIDNEHINWDNITYLGDNGAPTAAAVGLASANLDDTDASIEWEDAADLESDGSISANAVAMGTDTTGNYVATIADSGNSDVTVANSGSESAAITLAVKGVTLDDDSDVEIMADADGMDDDEFNGITITGRNCGENLTQWDLVSIQNDADPWHQADADAAGEFPAFGLSVAACTDGNEAKILVKGVVRNEGWTGLTPGGFVYLSETAGGLTQTAPSTSNSAVQIIGWALSDSEIYFDFSRPYQEVE